MLHTQLLPWGCSSCLQVLDKEQTLCLQVLDNDSVGSALQLIIVKHSENMAWRCMAVIIWFPVETLSTVHLTLYPSNPKTYSIDAYENCWQIWRFQQIHSGMIHILSVRILVSQAVWNWILTYPIASGDSQIFAHLMWSIHGRGEEVQRQRKNLHSLVQSPTALPYSSPTQIFRVTVKSTTTTTIIAMLIRGQQQT